MVNYYKWYYDRLQNTIFPKNLKLITFPYGNIGKAKTGYYTGTTPPKLIKGKNTGYWMITDEMCPPIFHNLYVPKDSLKAYQAWYKKYHSKKSVIWHTYEGSLPEISSEPDTEDETE